LRLLLFTGPGGAGTTTVAAATALHAARRGVKTLLLPLDADTVAPPLAAGAAPTAVLAGSPGTVEVEPGLAVRPAGPLARARRARAGLAAPLDRLAAALGIDPLDELELPALPLLDELAALLELRDAAAGGWDLVVVDAPVPLALRLAALPAGLQRAVGRLLPIERRMQWAAGDGSAAAPGRGLVLAAEQLVAELDGARELLRAPGTTARLVVPPQRPALEAAARARTGLALHGVAVDGVVTARLVPGGVDPWRADRARAEEAALADAAGLFAPLPVLRAAERPVGPTNPADLAGLGDELYGDDLPAAATPDPVPGQVVERDGDGYVLVLPLPGAAPGDVALARRGEELLLDVAGERRALRLPSGLQRCEVTGAAVRGGALRVTFRPDPALWRGL
jgi:arsenite-transporting ATPase